MSMFQRSTAVFVLLLLSACDKKSESSNAGGDSKLPTKTDRSARREREARVDDEMREAKAALRKAYEAAEKESDPAAREKALAAVAWDGIDVDSELAREAFAALTPGSEESRRLIAHFAMRMADDDPDGALEWARSLEQPEERGDAMSRVAVVISDSDPARATTLIAEEVPEGLPRNRATIQVVQRWSQKAPADAAAWVATLPAGVARNLALQNLATTWSQSDTRAFEAWAVKQDALGPEVVAATANSLGRVITQEERDKRLDAFSDENFRRRVEEKLKESAPPVLSLPPRSNGKPPER